MVLFILYLGNAFQCLKGICSQVPYEAVAYMIQFGALEFMCEVGAVAFYASKKRGQ